MAPRSFISGGLLVAFVLIAVAGIAWAGGAAYSDVPDEVTTTSTTVEQNVGGETLVATPPYATTIYDNETIVTESDVTLTEGTDYDWNSSEASITWYNTTDTTDGANATLTYSYAAKPDAARQGEDIMQPLLTRALPAALLLVVGFTIVGVGLGLRRVMSTSRDSLGR